ncbi:MAG: right-handed parallel beta-helix repeat-containing protein [Candidatus Hydrogenedentes bacterium]|nr:right-handed parallel beta-helix repeat-containing protein [Candidatus Hydrogenedentota bacterium]
MRSVRDFGAVGDGIADDTAAIQHAIDHSINQLHFEPGNYRITRPIVIDMAAAGYTSISGSAGTAKVIMDGPGPAFDFRGNHAGTADPESFVPQVWNQERMPLIQGLEIEGHHPEADGIHCYQTAMATFEGVLLRKLRHGIHFTQRARNVLISHCHIYDNSSVGIFFDHINTHQIIIASSHISYNKLSGIKILNGEIRNVQITGNDIEYNYDRHVKTGAPASAEIWIETTDVKATIREGTIVSNTIQSRYAPGGANIRFLGNAEENHKTGLFSITGNMIGSQETNIDLYSARGITISGNIVYSGHQRNLRATKCRNIVVSGNTFDHNYGYLPKQLATGITFDGCTDCTLTGSTIHDAYAGEHTVNTPAVIERKGLVELKDSKRMTISACQILDPGLPGIHVDTCDLVNIQGCSILDSREEQKMPHAIQWIGKGMANQIGNCTLSKGSGGAINAATESRVKLGDNLETA